MDQTTHLSLTDRIRGQARSHIWLYTRLDSSVDA
jgi:hypothetical protein